MVHSFWPLLIGIPLLVLFWQQQKKEPEQPYYMPTTQKQTPAAHAPYQDTVPKESPRWDNEQPMAQYPEQLPPMS
jgi:energy-converting hydrogenase Eha subunit F